MGSLTVVYDTNVLVSGIGWGGTPWQCLLLALNGDVELVTSEDALEEFERVLGYEKLPFTDEEVERFPELVRYEATIVEPTEDIQEIEADPDDDIFLEIAVEAGVDFIISGDRHLRDLDTFRGIPIYPPAEFVDADDSPDLDG